MRRRVYQLFMVALALVFIGMAATPVAATNDEDEAKQGIFLITGFWDCCEDEICKRNGCWLPFDLCDIDSDCELG